MGVDRWSQRRDRRPGRSLATRRAGWLVIALTAIAFAAATCTAVAGSFEAMEEGGPAKTIAQCKKRFPMHSSSRASCEQRVEKELAVAPGTSCQHPWEVNQSEGGHNGGERYVKITLKSTPKGVFTWHWQVMNRSVEICPRGITFEVIQALPNGDEDFKHPILIKHLPVTRSGSYSYATHAGVPVTNQDLKIEAWSRHPIHY